MNETASGCEREAGGRRERKRGRGKKQKREESEEGEGLRDQRQDWSMEGKTDIHVHCTCMIVQLYLECHRGRFMQSLVTELTVSHKQHHNLRRGRKRGAGEGNK